MKERNIALVMIYGFITLGIYDLVWLYKTRKEMIGLGAKIPSFNLLLAPLLGILIALALFLVLGLFSLSSPDTSFEGSSNGLKAAFNILGLLVIVASITAVIPITLYWMYKYTEAVQLVTHGQTTTGFAYGFYLLFVLLGLSFLWNGLIQDAFNKVAGSIPTASFPPQHSPPTQPPLQSV